MDPMKAQNLAPLNRLILAILQLVLYLTSSTKLNNPKTRKVNYQYNFCEFRHIKSKIGRKKRGTVMQVGKKRFIRCVNALIGDGRCQRSEGSCGVEWYLPCAARRARKRGNFLFFDRTDRSDAPNLRFIYQRSFSYSEHAKLEGGSQTGGTV